MDVERLDELCLGAGLEVGEAVGLPDIGEVRLTHTRSTTRKDVVVSMTTQRMEEEEERWRKLFPDIKKCRIMIVRPPLEQLRAWKWRRWGHHCRPHDSGTDCDWMQPLEPQECDGRSKSFVKKVEVRFQAQHAPEDRQGRPHRQLSLKQSSDVNTDSAPLHLMMDHTYCLHRGVRDEPESDSQSEDVRLPSCCGHKDCCCFSPEKMQHSIVFKKVWGDHWVLKKPEEEKEEEKEEEVQMQMRNRTKDQGTPLQSEKKKRRHGCGQCAACLRENCGKCNYCLDMKMFGGPSRLRQKCVMRRCLVVKTRKDWTVKPLKSFLAGKETVTIATQPQLHQWTKWKRWMGDAVEWKPASQRGKWGRMWGGKRMKLKNDRVQTRMVNGEEKQEKRRSSKEVRKRRWRMTLERRRAKEELKDSEDSVELRVKDEEDEQRRPTPQLQESDDPAERLMKEEPNLRSQFSLAGGGGASGLLNGTHLQLNLNVEGSRLSPSMRSNSALACLPQEVSVLHVSTGLTFIPPPPSPVQMLQPKEEEEPVEVNVLGRGLTGGGGMEELGCTERVSEKWRFYDVEVELLGCGSDQEMEMLSSPAPSDITVPVNDEVTACDITCQRPEFISLSSGLFELFGGGVNDDVTGGRGLQLLLQALRRTVLPAHWVAVLAEGPVLQLLQCSRLSSMTDTIVHVGPDRHVYVSVQNRLLPDTHRLYQEHTHRVEHLSQLVSLLLDLERMTICQGSRVRLHNCLQQVKSPACHLLLVPPCLTCLPCLLEEEEEEEEEEEDDDGGVETEKLPFKE
ncbi:methyl-CpG-binding domain protein 1a isoform X2 [Melanotaenia boesemani]|uniref:methyl-CpG-binding domain protein 1a isoform X2 n=1 Tax=Melanotaenia boesemani TaxID=1250792 RepID=UPI001C03C5FF|nr:methyl-CpG-binding domain protein 1a isoform X2 [Melanotaenia boesemani]